MGTETSQSAGTSFFSAHAGAPARRCGQIHVQRLLIATTGARRPHHSAFQLTTRSQAKATELAVIPTQRAAVMGWTLETTP